MSDVKGSPASCERLPAPVDLDDLLQPFSVRGVDLGLDRVRAALREGGHPERRFAAVQVAGTNGKGSICTFLHGILRAAGVHCGTYRSPHLVSWRERIQLDDGWIPAADLRADLLQWQAIAQHHRLTPFELLTAAAFGRFAQEAIQLAVLEVGLGGRLDATTSHPDRQVVGFGSIGMDHREHLGPTLSAIATEKAAVMTPGGVAISAPQHPEVRQVLEAEADRLSCELRWVRPLAPAAEGGPCLGLPGELQRHNAAVAVAMVEALAEREMLPAGTDLTAETVAQGLAEARWPGRLQRHRWRDRPLLIDGAHNPPAAVALRREVEQLTAAASGGHTATAGRRWLLGIQRHKEGPRMVTALLGAGDRAAIVPVPGHASWSASELVHALPRLSDRLETRDTLEEGLDWLMEAGALPVVAGSLYLVGAILTLLDSDG